MYCSGGAIHLIDGTAALHLINTTFDSQSALQGGQILYSQSEGDVFIENSTLRMTGKPTITEILIPQGGRTALYNNTVMQCKAGYQLHNMSNLEFRVLNGIEMMVS